jgi:hypothetical protein
MSTNNITANTTTPVSPPHSFSNDNEKVNSQEQITNNIAKDSLHSARTIQRPIDVKAKPLPAYIPVLKRIWKAFQEAISNLFMKKIQSTTNVHHTITDQPQVTPVSNSTYPLILSNEEKTMAQFIVLTDPRFGSIFSKVVSLDNLEDFQDIELSVHQNANLEKCLDLDDATFKTIFPNLVTATGAKLLMRNTLVVKLTVSPPDKKRWRN